MSDIVEQLEFLIEHGGLHRLPGEAAKEAADEITRLRAENERLRRRVDRYREAWESEKRRFTETMAVLIGDSDD